MSNDLIGMSSGLECVSIFDSSSLAAADDKFSGNLRFQVDDGANDFNFCSSSLSSSSSSSIGKNSDVSERSLSDGEDESGETEVQSSYNESFASMEALEEVLPYRRGISSFYNGKSKSFASLADTSSVSSMKNISKPENAYTRKRRNLLSFNHVISKKPSRNLSKSSLALAVAMSSSESINTTTSDDSGSMSPFSRPCLDITPKNLSSWRSYSVADLQHCENHHSSGKEDI